MKPFYKWRKIMKTPWMKTNYTALNENEYCVEENDKNEIRIIKKDCSSEFVLKKREI